MRTNADVMTSSRPWGVIGAPTSAAAHWPGVELAPQALRARGLIESLTRAGVALEDHGDLPMVRWRGRREHDEPNDVARVVHTLREVAATVERIVERGQRPLVLGGECTLAMAAIDALRRHHAGVGMVYVDGGQDLMIPVDHPAEPILDGMGVAHLLDLPGVDERLAGFGHRRPLLRADDVVFVGYADEEEDVHGLVPSARFPASIVRRNPIEAARGALDALPAEDAVFHLHVDVDVLDFLELPAADVPVYGRGLRIEELTALVRALARDPRCAALTFVEFNPAHGEPDGSTARALVELLASVLGDQADGRAPASAASVRRS